MYSASLPETCSTTCLKYITLHQCIQYCIFLSFVLKLTFYTYQKLHCAKKNLNLIDYVLKHIQYDLTNPQSLQQSVRYHPFLAFTGSGAMVAVIVIGIIIILTFLLIVLKTYNRYGDILMWIALWFSHIPWGEHLVA